MPSGWPADGGYLVALLPRGVVAVGVREVDMTGSDPHDLLDVPTPFADHMGVLRVGYVHLQSHLVHLGRGTHNLKSSSQITSSNYHLNGSVNNIRVILTLVSRTSRIFLLASRTLALFPSTFTWGS